MYKIVGEVIHGDKNGRKLGFPTANITLKESDLEDATFCVNIGIGKQIYSGVGVYLPFKEVFEVHIFDFREDIYGENITIYIKSKIRKNRKFNNFEELQEQIERDINLAKTKKHTVLTFGSFDCIHPGHTYYLSEAKKYSDMLLTIVASDSNISTIKQQAPQNNQKQRIDDIEKLSLSDIVIAGSDTNPLQWISKYSPSSICLGYDQRGPFVDKISTELDVLQLETQIIRIAPHKPEEFKSSLLKAKK